MFWPSKKKGAAGRPVEWADYCSWECFTELRREQAKPKRIVPTRLFQCHCCGDYFVAKASDRKYCSDDCRSAVSTLQARYRYRVAAALHGATPPKMLIAAHRRRTVYKDSVDHITIDELGERDKWRCGLCGKTVIKRGRRRWDPEGPSIDHLVPVSLGGTHTWANVQLAHNRCNIGKSNRPAGEQLRLVG